MGTPNKSIRMTTGQHAIVKKIVASMKANAAFIEALNDFHENWVLSEKKKAILILQEEIAQSISADQSKPGLYDDRLPEATEAATRNLETITSVSSDWANDGSSLQAEQPLRNPTTDKTVLCNPPRGKSDPKSVKGQTKKAPSVMGKPAKSRKAEVATTDMVQTDPEGVNVMREEQTIASQSIGAQTRSRTAASRTETSILSIELPPETRPPLPRVVSALTAYAESLIDKRIDTGDGQSRVMTRAEMEHDIQKTMEVSRNAAQRAATNAVERLDPDNPHRWGRKRPIARVVSLDTRQKMVELRRQGLTLQQIAQQVGFDARIVRKYTATEMRNQAITP